VEYNQPPGSKNEKLVGADSTANDFGGMCMERTTKALYSVWVQAEGSKVVQLPIAAHLPTFVTFELPDVAIDVSSLMEQPSTTVLNALGEIGATLDEERSAVALPREPDPFDGRACLLAGYWKHQKVDPADAVIYHLRAYRTWSQAQIDADRAEWASLFEPDVAPPNGGGGNGGPPEPGPPGELPSVDPRATQVRMDVLAGAEQQWRGFGYTMSSPASAPKAAPLAAKWPNKLFEDLGVTWLGGYGASPNYKAFAQLGKQHGVKEFFCHGFVYRQSNPPARLAQQIKDDVDNGIPWTAVCVQNEPDGNPANRWAGYPGNLGRVVDDTKALRRELDARGLQHVKIVTCCYAHFGSQCDAEFDALVAAGFTPDGLGGHCYSDCPTPENFTRARKTKLGGAFSTETGYADAANSPARFLAAMNNGASVHLQFEGQAVDDGAEAIKNCLITVGGQTRPWYNSYKVLSPPLHVGSMVRRMTSDNRPSGMSVAYAKWMVRHREASGLVYPKFHAACAKRPDGKWWLGACNATFGSTATAPNLGAHWGAERGQLTVRVAELAGKHGTWTGQRSTGGGGSIKPPETVVMRDGFLRVTLEPGETLALVGG
jgi:hypothetical protein